MADEKAKKKLVVDKIQYGFVPYGPGLGNQSLGIYFREEDGEYTYAAPETEDKKVYTAEEIAAHGLLEDIVKIIKDNNLVNKWSEFNLGRNYGYFVGPMLAANEHRAVALKLFEFIDTMALQIQKKILEKEIPDEEKRKAAIMKGGIRPPLSVLVCGPDHYTGRDTFYEAFRIVVCKYPLEENPKFNQMAVVETSNHVFCVGIFDIKDFESNTKVIHDAYESINALTLPNDRIFVIDRNNDKRVADYALERGYRLNKPLDYGDSVVLDF